MDMLEKSLFPVTEMPVPHPFHGDEGWENQPTGYKFILNEDSGEIISCLSDDYKLVSNKRLIDAVKPSVERLGGKLVEVNMFGGLARTSYKFRFNNNIGVLGDKLFPEIIIKNSYDGTVGIHIIAGVFRLICTNGLIVGTIVDESNNKHLVRNKNIELLEKNMDETIDKMNSLMGGIVGNLMSVSPVKSEHIIKLISIFPDMIAPFVVEKMRRDKPNNYWDLLNIGTWVATHKMNRNAESTHKFESTLFDIVSKQAGIIGRA